LKLLMFLGSSVVQFCVIRGFLLFWVLVVRKKKRRNWGGGG